MKNKQKKNHKAALELLNYKERIIFRIALFANNNLGLLIIAWQKILLFTINRVYVNHTVAYNIDRLSKYGKDSKIILVSNHRSLFDNFIIITQIFNHFKNIPRRTIFPVRSNFWYDSVQGLLTNIIGSGIAMFPPIFRQNDKKIFNNYAISLISQKLANKKGLVVGVHPEGTRNKDTDLYSVLEPKQGVGKIALSSPAAIVIPVFIHNASCSVMTEIKRNYCKKNNSKISIIYGNPVELEDLKQKPLNQQSYKEVASRCMDEIKKLAEEMKKIHNIKDNN